MKKPEAERARRYMKVLNDCVYPASISWPAELYSARLYLRPFNVLDTDALFALASDPRVAEPCGWQAHTSYDMSRDTIKLVLSMPLTFAICARSRHNALVGAIALKPVFDGHGYGRTLELGFWIGVPYQRQGFATEAATLVLNYAFEELKLDEVIALTSAYNSASIKTQEAVGMREEWLDFDPSPARVVHSITAGTWRDRQIPSAGPFERKLQQEEAKYLIESLPTIGRVVSGGQTGADRAALDAARAHNIPLGGWCPPEGLAEDYPEAPGLLAAYPELTEGASSGYVERTALNVRDSHATLIVAPLGLEPQSGTEMTVRFAKAFGRPYLVVAGPQAAGETLAWIQKLGRGLTLNVAGPRESKLPGTYRATYELLDVLLGELERQA